MTKITHNEIPLLSDEEREKRLLSTAGFARRAGKIAMGTQLLCESMRRKEVLLVIEAADTSDNTHKRITDKAAFYHVPYVRLSTVTSAMMGAAFGKSGLLSAVGITEEGFVRACRKYLLETTPSEEKQNPNNK